MSIVLDTDPWKHDLMMRKGVAKFLSQHLDASEHIKVLNVNSEWGSGKTFFCKHGRKNRMLSALVSILTLGKMTIRAIPLCL
ncbi:P-loop NTPase fold protein [Pseudomonas syringae]|uniref:P-loop NTPase fold protein n=1 Tax=Pseudomonas syringae TaxID=317 RepID=UPI000E31E1F5